MKKLFLYFLILINSTFVLAQDKMLHDQDIYPKVKQTLDYTYNFQFNEARKLNEEIRLKYPNHPAYDLLMSLNYYWETFYYDAYVENSPKLLSHLNNTINKSAKLLEKYPNDPEFVFFKLAGEAYLTLYHSERNESSNTFSVAKKAYNTLKIAMEVQDKLSELKFPIGLYEYFIVQYPENRPFFKVVTIFFKPGSKEKGFKNLDYVWNNATYTKSECCYHLTNIYLKYENTPLAAEPYAKASAEKYPNNMFFAVKYIEVLIAKGDYKTAEQYIRVIENSPRPFFKAAAHLFIGQINEKGYKNLIVAAEHYHQAIDAYIKLNNPEKDYLSFAYAGMGRIALMRKQQATAEMYYKKCKEIAEYTSMLKECKHFFKEN